MAYELITPGQRTIRHRRRLSRNTDLQPSGQLNRPPPQTPEAPTDMARTLSKDLPTGLFTSTQACQVAGCSYRQCDYWARTGMIAPSIDASGSGYSRGWSTHDVEAMRALTLMVNYQAASVDHHLRPALREVVTRIQSGEIGDWAVINRHGYAALLTDREHLPADLDEVVIVRFRHTSTNGKH